MIHGGYICSKRVLETMCPYPLKFFDYDHQKTFKVGCFDGKGALKMPIEILLYLTVRYSSRLLHYTIVKKWEVLTTQFARL